MTRAFTLAFTLEDLASVARQAADALAIIADALTDAARSNGATVTPILSGRQAAEPSVANPPPPPPPAPPKKPEVADARRAKFQTITFADPETCRGCARRIAIGQVGLMVDDYSTSGGWISTRAYHMTCDPRRPALAKAPGPNVRVPTPPEPRPDTLKCPDCPERVPFASLAALRSHQRSRHP